MWYFFIHDVGAFYVNLYNTCHNIMNLYDADYADDLPLLANVPTQAETLLHSLERAAADIGLHVNVHKTEYMCSNKTSDISTLNSSALKIVDKFTYLGSSVSSIETDIDTLLAKPWTAIDSLSVIWKSVLIDKMNHSFFQAAVETVDTVDNVDTSTWMKHMDANKTYTEKDSRQLFKNAMNNIEQVLDTTLHEEATVQPPSTHYENYQN